MPSVTTVFTNAGLAVVTNRIKGLGNEPNYIHWGTGTSTPQVTDTALQSPRSESRVAGTSSIVTTTVTNDTYRVTGTLTVSGTNATISEVGLFDASTSGNMIVRAVFDGLPLVVGDSVTFTIDVTSGV